MSPRRDHRTWAEGARGAAAVVALLLLAMTGLVVSSLVLASAGHGAASALGASSVQAFYAAEAGRAIATAALAQGASPALPPPYAADFDIEFTPLELSPTTEDYRILGRFGLAERAIRISLESN